MFPRVPTRATFVADTKNVSDFVQKHFVSATNVSQFAQHKKHHEQQCVLVCQGLYMQAELTLDLFTVFDTNLTGRQGGQKLLCLYGNWK